MAKLSPRLVLTLIAVACAASVGAALLAQHRYGMEPCPWCILQRIIFIVLAVLSLLAAALPAALPRRVSSAVLLALPIAGIAAALWQHFVAAKSSSCNLTLADRIITGLGLDARWPDIFEVRASCADAAASVLGVPFEFWSLMLFVIVGLGLAYSAASKGGRA